MNLGMNLGLGISNRNRIPGREFLAALFTKNSEGTMTDSIGLLVSDYDSIDPTVQSVFFSDPLTKRTDADIVTIALASPWLNTGGTMFYTEAKGLFLYTKTTDSVTLSKAYKYAGLPFINKLFVMQVKTDNVGTTSATSIGLPVAGTFQVEWGDGIVQTITGAVTTMLTTHSYGVAGTYTIRIASGLTRINFGNIHDKLKLLSIANLGHTGFTDLRGAFNGCESLTNFCGCNSDTSTVTDMAFMFRNSVNTVNIDMSWLNINAVTTMAYIFDNSGISAESYSRTLIHFANEHYAGRAKNNLNMSNQNGCIYNATVYSGEPFNNAVDARNYLASATASGGAGWTITGDALV